MNHAPTESPAPSQPRRSSLRPLALIVGWAGLAYFAVCTAWLGSIEANVVAFQTAYIVGFAGYLILLLSLRGSVHQANPGRWRGWLAGMILIRLFLVAVEPTDDAYRYIWEGRLQLAGYNPYAHAPNEPALESLRTEDWSRINHPDYPAIYPPLVQLVMAGAAAFSGSIYAAKATSMLFDLGTVLALASCLRFLGRRPQEVLGYALCPLVLSAFAVEGHIDSLMLFCGALCLRLILSRRFATAGVCLGLAMASKLILAVLLPWFLFRHRRTAVIALAVWGLTYVPYVSAGGALFESLQRFSSEGEFFSFLGTIGITSFEDPSSRIIIAIVGVAILTVLAYRQTEFLTYSRSAVGVVLLMMPIVHYWYLSWVLLFQPFRRQWPWLVASLLMVGYFEGIREKTLTGSWSVPLWVSQTVWLSFAAAWFADLTARTIHSRRAQRHER